MTLIAVKDDRPTPVDVRQKRAEAFVEAGLNPEEARARGKANRGRRQERIIPALDVAALNRQYGMQAAERGTVRAASFRMPVAASETMREQVRRKAITTFIEAMDKQGWDLVSNVTVQEGSWPAIDMMTNLALPDMQEYHIAARFYLRNLKPLRIPLDPKLVAPVTVRG